MRCAAKRSAPMRCCATPSALPARPGCFPKRWTPARRPFSATRRCCSAKSNMRGRPWHWGLRATRPGRAGPALSPAARRKPRPRRTVCSVEPHGAADGRIHDRCRLRRLQPGAQRHTRDRGERIRPRRDQPRRQQCGKPLRHRSAAARHGRQRRPRRDRHGRDPRRRPGRHGGTGGGGPGARRGAPRRSRRDRPAARSGRTLCRGRAARREPGRRTGREQGSRPRLRHSRSLRADGSRTAQGGMATGGLAAFRRARRPSSRTLLRQRARRPARKRSSRRLDDPAGRPGRRRLERTPRPQLSGRPNPAWGPRRSRAGTSGGRKLRPPQLRAHMTSAEPRTDGAPRIAPSPLTAALEPETAARMARLRYVRDDMPGITRRKTRSGFSYRRPDGEVVRDAETLRRIRALAIPPAWTAVWICPYPEGHLQATGRDARGRKQYRYHPRWRAVRDESKFAKMLIFGRALPQIRARVEADLQRRGLRRERVLAAVVRLMELTLFRIGNPEYAKENKHFGLTTLRRRHVAIEGAHIRLNFRGKGGARYESDINDRRLANIVKQCRDLPGYELFQYLDEDGNRHTVDSEDVNDYLRQISGE